MTVNPVILTEKLRRPEPAGLARARLENRLLSGSTSRLDLVVAPPGSGKTTLLARVAAVAAAAATPVAWYRVTDDDIAEATLVAHLARSLGDALGSTIEADSIAGLLAALENGSRISGLLILDDLHEISGSPAEHALERFIQLRPHSLRVLVGSRRQPEMNIPRLRVSGLLQEVSSDDLRFRSWEVEELFIGVFREPLSPESAAALTRRTGGWAAGLQLFHLATLGRSAVDRQRAVDDLGGRSKLIRSYLARNVLAELPEERRQFLLRTCTLGTLTGALCDALLGISGSRRVLDELEQQQLFTSSEDDGETFRYHEVLRSHLEWALVEEYGATGARQWYSRSAELLETNHDLRGAARAYARAEDWGAVARIVQAGGAGADDSMTGGLLLPASIVRHDPWLSLAEARRRAREGALSAAGEGLRQAEGLLDEPEFRDNCRRERSVLALWAGSRSTSGWALNAAGAAQHWSVPVRAATRRGTAQRPADDGRGSSTAGGQVWRSGQWGPQIAPAGDGTDRLARGLIALLEGDFERSSGDLKAVERDRAIDSTHRLLAALAGTVIDLISNRCADPAARLGQIALDAELAGLPWVARLARGVGEAVLVAIGSPAWRLAALSDLLTDCDRAGDVWGAALLRLASAIAVAIVDPAADPVDFTDAARRFDQLDAPVLASWAESLRACVLAGQARPDAAELSRTAVAQAKAAQSGGSRALAMAAVALSADHRASDELEPPAGGSGLLVGLTQFLRSAGELNAPEDSLPPAADHRDQQITPTRAGSIAVRCFGGFTLEVNGSIVDLTELRPRARALLRLLAVSPDRAVHREHLVDALWPGVDLLVGTRRLQVALSSVRQLLEHAGLSGSEVVARHGDAYRFSLPTGSFHDVRSFEDGLRGATTTAESLDTLARVTAREAALTLYRGDLLPEDGPADYLIADRERLRLMAATAALALAQDSRSLRRMTQALAAARLSVQLDRFQDLAWELLAELHEESGDSSAAARVRREHAEAQAELELSSI
ncbi:MAG: AAA family ATPase [Nakamurella sp.]